MSYPEPVRSLRKFIREYDKAEKEANRFLGPDKFVTGGEIIFGSVTHNGKKTLHRLAIETNSFVTAVRKFVMGE